MTGEQLELTGCEALVTVEDLEVIEAVTAADELTPVPVSFPEDRVVAGLADRNLFGEAARIAERRLLGPGGSTRRCTAPSALAARAARAPAGSSAISTRT